VDLHIFHTNTYWTCFCIKWIQSFGEEVVSVVAKGGGEGRRVCTVPCIMVGQRLPYWSKLSGVAGARE